MVCKGTWSPLLAYPRRKFRVAAECQYPESCQVARGQPWLKMMVLEIIVICNFYNHHNFDLYCIVSTIGMANSKWWPKYHKNNGTWTNYRLDNFMSYPAHTNHMSCQWEQKQRSNTPKNPPRSSLSGSHLRSFGSKPQSLGQYAFWDKNQSPITNHLEFKHGNVSCKYVRISFSLFVSADCLPSRLRFVALGPQPLMLSPLKLMISPRPSTTSVGFERGLPYWPPRLCAGRIGTTVKGIEWCDRVWTCINTYEHL